MGKRTYRRNIWGNVVGYESGRRAWEFGCEIQAEAIAAEWCKGGTPSEAEDRYWDSRLTTKE